MNNESSGSTGVGTRRVIGIGVREERPWAADREKACSSTFSTQDLRAGRCRFLAFLPVVRGDRISPNGGFDMVTRATRVTRWCVVMALAAVALNCAPHKGEPAADAAPADTASASPVAQ